MRQPRIPFVMSLAAAACLVSVPSVSAQARPSLLDSVAQSAAAAGQAAPQATGQPSGQGGEVRPLTVDEAVQLALQDNLGIRIERLAPQIQDVAISQARSGWAPNLTSSLNRQSQSSPATTTFTPNSQTGTLNTSVGMSQTLPWGGSYQASWSSSRQTTTNIFNNFSPELQSTFAVAYRQPLMRNFRIDSIREQVSLSKKLRDLSDVQLEGVIAQTTRNVKNAYWDLAYAINNLAATKESLALAQQNLSDNQKRVNVGTMAPIDIVQAQAEVASNEQNVIVAEAAISSAQDRLRALIFDPDSPNFWQIQIQPTDTVAFQNQNLDVNAAIQHALATRTDLREAKNSLQRNDIGIEYMQDQLRPDVSATVNYSAYGIGGSQLQSVDFAAIGSGSPIPQRTVLSQVGFGSVLGDVFGSAFPTWSFGVSFGYPLGTSTAEANLAQARLQNEQAQTSLKNLELQVATQVRDAARQVETNQKRVDAARAARVLQEQKLDAEQKKFAAGLSTNFEVIQAQRDLALARTTEVQAISDYNKSLVDFEAVQEVPLNGAP
jgi:outer membrane protein